jgi:hypothetical protein
LKIFKIIITDFAGFGLVVLAILTGWLPGPGGIPLLLAGIGLLSINHEWARKILHNIKTYGLKFFDRIFVDHPMVKILYDSLAIALFSFGVYLLVKLTGFTQTVSLIFVFLGITLFLGNRQRLKKIQAYFKTKA